MGVQSEDVAAAMAVGERSGTVPKPVRNKAAAARPHVPHTRHPSTCLHGQGQHRGGIESGCFAPGNRGEVFDESKVFITATAVAQAINASTAATTIAANTDPPAFPVFVWLWVWRGV